MTDFLAITVLVLRTIIFFVLYIMIGFGPGFVIGMLLANWVFGKGKPLRMDNHLASMQKAAEHNKQWDPNSERWQK